MNIINRLRDTLQPRGTAPVVQLRLAGHGMFNSDFVSKCIDDLEKLPLRSHLGEHPSNLEKLAYQLLMDSAYIDLEHERNREQWLKDNT
jgi:hypothetical protein